MLKPTAPMDLRLLALAFALGLPGIACGSEAPPGTHTGEGGAAGAPATTGGTSEDSHFPLVDGAVSIYRHSSKGGWEETTMLSETAPGVYLEVDTGHPEGERTESILEVDAEGRVFRTEKDVYVDDVLDSSVSYEPGFIRYDPAWLDLRVNESMTYAYERTETPAGGSPDPTRPRAHVYTSFGRESLTVLGARYNDCLVIRRERDYDDVDGEAEDEKKQIYFAPGVGKVQEINVDSGNTEQLVSTSE